MKGKYAILHNTSCISKIYACTGSNIYFLRDKIVSSRAEITFKKKNMDHTSKYFVHTVLFNVLKWERPKYLGHGCLNIMMLYMKHDLLYKPILVSVFCINLQSQALVLIFKRM